ncbi:unnamed protein product [Moneuplotes crassus]|uniref:tRNA (guanine(37)-N1)-methyltransferase n=3 Tax=Euplotes crassus TaxID=5936 RepID=A0AAD1XE27_EUPCR|nr:unnamed protein product [Moneuplotes crassus]
MESTAPRTTLDKSIFDSTIKILAAAVPVKLIGKFQGQFKSLLLQIPAIKNVVPVEGDKTLKHLLLDKEFGTDPESLPDNLKQFIKDNEIKLEEKEISIGYANISCHEALEKVIPEGVVIPTGFESVGHIAHMNLNEEQMLYKYDIGQIFLEKNPAIKTVLTKVGHIENTFRTFNFEVLAGEETFETTQNEDGIKFDVDITKVYWCSRLGQERSRVIEEFFKPGDVVCDMFCGIGPLSVRAAKDKGIKVLANDLNPDCYHYLRRNIVQNKVADLVLPFCMDGREFVKHCVLESNNQDVLNKEEEKKEPVDPKNKKKKRAPSQKEEEEKLVPENETITPIKNRSFLHFDHVYMNLPMDAVEFLDAFIGIFNNANPEIWNKEDKPEGVSKGEGLPLIHVYGFTTENQDTDKAKEYFTTRIAEVFKDCGGFTEDKILKFHNNREVSRVSSMYCVTFRLPEEVAYYNPHKRQKTDEEGE